MNISNSELITLVNEAVSEYGDVDTPIWKCLETWFVERGRMTKDDAYDLSMEMLDKYIRL